MASRFILNKEITVLGEVRDPQVIKIDKDDNTLLEIISQCKGFEFYADIENIKILRQDGENVKVATVDLSESGDYTYKNIQLHASDIVIIPAKNSKTFDKRVSIIVPLATTVTAAVLLFGAFAN